MKFSIIYFVCLTILVYPTNVYAYLDPVSGSVILQSIIGVIAASILVIKTYWYKLKRLFKKLINQKDKNNNNPKKSQD